MKSMSEAVRVLLEEYPMGREFTLWDLKLSASIRVKANTKKWNLGLKGRWETMPHKKSPQLRAGCLGAYKSSNEIIANSNTKNNASDLIQLRGVFA